ncbi:unnamed protein product [Cochlearia groenlandica]
MDDSEAVQKPVVVDPPLDNEAPPSVSRRRRFVVAGAPPAENHLIQRIQRALVELRELRNQFNAILRELEIQGGGEEEEEEAESSVEDPEDDSDS